MMTTQNFSTTANLPSSTCVVVLLWTMMLVEGGRGAGGGICCCQTVISAVLGTTGTKTFDFCCWRICVLGKMPRFDLWCVLEKTSLEDFSTNLKFAFKLFSRACHLL